MNALNTYLPAPIGLVGLGLCFALPGCLSPAMGGQTGGEVETPLCVEQSEPITEEVSTALGFSPTQAAAVFAQGETATVSPTWMAPLDPARVNYVAPTNETSISFSQTRAAGQARFVRSQVNTDGKGQQSAVGMVEEPCRDHLELAVRMTLSTSTGELNENYNAILRVYTLEDARVDARLDARKLSGTLQITTTDPTIEELDLQVSVKLGADALAVEGVLELLASAVDDNNASYSSTTFATW